MTTLLWICLVSFLGAAIMVLYRRYEIMTGKEIISSTTRAAIDARVIRWVRAVTGFLRRRVSGIVHLVSALSHRIHDYLHTVWRKISNKVDKYFDDLRARRDIGKRGSVSLYWQQMSKDTQE